MQSESGDVARRFAIQVGIVVQGNFRFAPIRGA
jgi:hypothetical protein